MHELQNVLIRREAVGRRRSHAVRFLRYEMMLCSIESNALREVYCSAKRALGYSAYLLGGRISEDITSLTQ